jgi:hypothetical protein
MAAEWQRERGQNDSDSAISVAYGGGDMKKKPKQRVQVWS